MSAALLFAFCSPPSVAEHQIFDPDFEQIYEIGTRLLGDIEHEKDMYGLGSVNFDNLYIGEYIPAYITSANGIIQSDIRILSNNRKRRVDRHIVLYKNKRYLECTDKQFFCKRITLNQRK